MKALPKKEYDRAMGVISSQMAKVIDEQAISLNKSLSLKEKKDD